MGGSRLVVRRGVVEQAGGEEGDRHTAKQLQFVRSPEARPPREQSSPAAGSVRGGPAEGSLNPQVTRSGFLRGTGSQPGSGQSLEPGHCSRADHDHSGQ